MGEFPSGQRGQTVNLLSLTSMVRIHLLPPNKKHPEGCFFCLVGLTSGGSQPPAGGTSASLKCGRNLRFPHKRPLPDCGEGGGIQDTFLSGGGWLLLEAGCCGQGRRFAPMRQKPAVPSQSSRNSFLSKCLVRRQPQYKRHGSGRAFFCVFSFLGGGIFGFHPGFVGGVCLPDPLSQPIRCDLRHRKERRGNIILRFPAVLLPFQ